MSQKKLVDQSQWETYWERVVLPLEVKKVGKGFKDEMLKIFDRFLPKNPNLSILEIGGAPGAFLIYMAKNFHYRISSLDYSRIGCKKTKENLALLNLKGTVYQADLFSDTIARMPLFDIVYSLGFVEHFSDLDEIIEKHLKLLKPGGILLIGVPNFLGINHWMLKRLNPALLDQHNLTSMDLKNWEILENRFKLKPLFKGYVGGLEPRVFLHKNKKVINQFLYYSFRILRIATDAFAFLRKYNSKYWSGYAMMVYEYPHAPLREGKE